LEFKTSAPPHVVAGFTVPRVMYQVLLALVPVTVVQALVFGPGVLVQIAVAGATALGSEGLALRLRNRPTRLPLRDGSVLVTAALIALSVPPLLPWWLTALGTAIAVLLAKHAYGGL
jgi:electron transport complex protein RnfD